jgi:hypothetical protein
MFLQEVYFCIIIKQQLRFCICMNENRAVAVLLQPLPNAYSRCLSPLQCVWSYNLHTTPRSPPCSVQICFVTWIVTGEQIYPNSSSNVSICCQRRTNATDFSSLFRDGESKCLVNSHSVQKTNNHLVIPW